MYHCKHQQYLSKKNFLSLRTVYFGLENQNLGHNITCLWVFKACLCEHCLFQCKIQHWQWQHVRILQLANQKSSFSHEVPTHASQANVV